MHFVLSGPKIFRKKDLEEGSKTPWIVWFDPLFLLHTTEAQWIGSTTGHPSDEESPDSHYV